MNRRNFLQRTAATAASLAAHLPWVAPRAIVRPWHASLSRAIADIRAGRTASCDQHLILPRDYATFGDGSEILDRAVYLSNWPISVRTVAECKDAELVRFLSCVNDRPFCGADAGQLLLGHILTDRDVPGATYGFLYRKQSWNQLLAPDGTWREVVSAAGQTIYQPVDFRGLP